MGVTATPASAVQVIASQFGGGLLTLSAGALVTISTYFLAATTDTNRFGFTASVSVHTASSQSLGSPVVIYTNAALSSITTVSCEADLTVVSGDSSTGNIICSNSNIDFGTGTAVLSFSGASTSFGFYVGATSTEETATSIVTDDVPGNTVYLHTATETTYETTVTSTSTTTLTGDLFTSYCTPTTTTSVPGTTTTSAPVTTSPPKLTCSKDSVYQTLAHHGNFAGYFCKDLLAEKHHTFPAKISVWPPATISSACSCYQTSMLSKRRTDDFGPPTAYPVPTSSTTVVSTDDVSTPVTVSTYTSNVDGGTYTAEASTTVTVDQRTAPTTCVSSQAVAPTRKRSNPPTCHGLTLQAAYLYVEVAKPLHFCNYYLSAKRTRSPLLGINPVALAETCACVIKETDGHMPTYKSDVSGVSEGGTVGCNEEHAREIRGFFKQAKAFCTYWGEKENRGMTPIYSLNAADVYAGCQCISP